MKIMYSEDYSINLQIHTTKDINDSHVNGSLTVIWRDYDNIINNNPKMVYMSSVNPNEVKGPHTHTKRNSYFSCIHGSIVLIVKDDDEKFHEIKSDSEKPVLVSIPNGTAFALINPTEMIAKVLVLADIAWKPDDNEMDITTFDDYDWRKWSKNHSTTKK